MKQYKKCEFMKTVKKKTVNPYTGQIELIEMPAPEVVTEAIFELEYSPDGIRVVDATEALAEKFQLSDKQKRAKNRSDLNVFRYDVVAPQFRRLLGEGKLKQPKGPRSRYFLAESVDVPSAVGIVERPAVNSDTGEEYQITLPATHDVKQALLNFEYPGSGIEIKDIAEALAGQFALTDEQKEARGKYGLIWRRHVNIAANSLVNSGQLLRMRIGWIINPYQLDVEISDSDAASLFSDGEISSPEAGIAQNYRDHLNRLKEELLQKIMDNPPDFFEELVLDLLVKMGYGGSSADAEAVGRSGDGGIDGVIKADPLGLDSIYVQAKRWTEGSVGSPDIDKFYGALARRGANKGIFITTSTFSDPAKAAANESAGPTIVLIDGNQLVQLMIDHNVGVSSGNFYQLKEVDLDYFAIDDMGDGD